MNKETNKLLNVFLGFLLVALPVVLATSPTALAQPPGPPEIGLTLTDEGKDAGTLYPGDSAIVQVITAGDSDDNSNDVTVKKAEIANLGDATAADIEKVEVLRDGTVKGSETVGSFPVDVPLTDFTVADDGSAKVEVKVYVSDSPSASTLELQTTLVHDEGNNTDLQRAVADGVVESIAERAPVNIGVYRQSNGTWYYRSEPTSGVTDGKFNFGGRNSDIPVVGDLNGDGEDDVVIYRQSTGTWYIDTNDDQIHDKKVNFGGGPSDMPVIGDVTGDGEAEMVIYRQSNGTWYYRSEPTSGVTDGKFNFGGAPTDRPVLGDLSGINSTSLGFETEPGSQTGLVLNEATSYPNPVSKQDSVTFSVQGKGIEAMKVDVFTASGSKVFSSGFREKQALNWNLTGKAGKVANGIYLYSVAIEGAESSLVSDVQKLLVLQ